MKLEEIIKSKKLGMIENKFGTDKFELKSYIKYYYEDKFKAYRDHQINIIEIGVRNGSSLVLWEQYFKYANIIGIDNFSDSEIDVNQLQIIDSYNRIKLIKGDAYSDELISTINDDLDIVIDDGPHDLNSQIIFIKKYSKKLKPGGILVIEDIISGGCSIIPLTLAIPSGFVGRFYDFRLRKFKSDNCIFDVKKSSGILHTFINRVSLYLIGAIYLIFEGGIRALKKKVKLN